MLRYLKFVLQVILCLISSAYLTALVSARTLTTDLQVAFVFCYFLVLAMVALACCRKYLRDKPAQRAGLKLLLSLTLALLCVVSCGDTLVPKATRAASVTITATGAQNESAQGSEVRITAVRTNGAEIDLTKVPLAEGWQLDEYGGLLCNPSDGPKSLKINFEKASQIEISFLVHPWSGMVHIQDGTEDTTLDLFSPEATDRIYEVQSNLHAPYVWLGFSALCFLFIVIYFLLVLNEVKSQFWIGLYLLICCAVVIPETAFSIDQLSRYLLLLTLLLFGCGFYTAWVAPEMQKYKKGVSLAAIPLLTFIFTFMLCGQRLFFKQVTVTSLSTFLLVMIAIYPASFGALRMLEKGSIFFRLGTAGKALRSKDKTLISKRLLCGILTAIFAFIIVLPIGDALFYKRNAGTIYIEPLNQKGQTMLGTEVWVIDMVVDGKPVDLRTITPVTGWLRNDSGQLVFYGGDYVIPLTIHYPKANRIFIKLLHHPWSGLVRIYDGEESSTTDLSDQTESFFYQVQGNKMALPTHLLILAYVGTFAILFCALYLLGCALYQKVSSKIDPFAQRTWIYLFLTGLLINGIYFICCYPGVVNMDSSSQWGQALGVYPLTDAHPVFTTLFLRICSFIYPSISVAVAIQVIITISILSSTLTFLTKLGLPRKVAIFFLAMLCLLPSNAFLIVSVTKDVLYCDFLLLLGLSLYKLLWWRVDIPSCIQFVIAAVGIVFYRHEGSVVLAVVLVVTVPFFFIAKSRKKCTLVLLVAFLLMSGMNFAKTRFVTNSPSVNLMPAHLLLGVREAGGELPETASVYLDTVFRHIPSETLSNLHDYYNSDVIFWSGQYRTQILENASDITTSDGARSILATLYKEPRFIITSKLKENNILWNVFQCSSSFHDMGGWISSPNAFNEFGFEVQRNVLAPILQRAQQLSTQNDFINSIFWRYGWTILLWMLSVVFCMANKRIKCMWFSLPSIIQWGVLMVALTFQVYRYIWILGIVSVIQLVFALQQPAYTNE